MKGPDYLLQRWRINRVARWIPARARVLDIGCDDGALFRQLADRQLSGLGLDPLLPAPQQVNGIPLLPGSWPVELADQAPFDVITMLAVMEHIPEARQPAVAQACYRALRPGGVVLMTVPSPQVDAIESLLLRLKLIDGMSFEQHYGFDVRRVRPCFEAAGFTLVKHRRFQLGLNNLFVFRR